MSDRILCRTVALGCAVDAGMDLAAWRPLHIAAAVLMLAVAAVWLYLADEACRESHGDSR